MTDFENIGWTVGNFCNAKCGHCYSWKVRRTSEEFLTRGDVDKIVDQLSRLGVKTVNLGGNEPIYTHGPDHRETLLPYIIDKVVHAGMLVGLTTNGLTMKLLRENFPDQMMLLNDVDFSLDAPNRAEHDANRGAHLFDLVLREIEEATKRGIDCSIIFCGMKANFNQQTLEEFLALAQTLGTELRVNTLKPVEDSLADQMPTADQFYEGFAFLMQNTDCVTLGESCVSAFVGNGHAGCPCGKTSFRINAKTAAGKIPLNPCVYMHEFASGDLLTDDIFEIVNGDLFSKFSARRQNLPQACKDADCSYIETCRGGCTARTFLVTKDLESADPYCPLEYEARAGRPELPVNPSIGLEEGVRVHDNYLCTWIGDPHEHWIVPERLSGTDWWDTTTDAQLISEHTQNSSTNLPSLTPVTVELGRRDHS